MDDSQLEALAAAIGDLCTALDPSPERAHPIGTTERAARRARKTLTDAGFTLPNRADLVDPEFKHHDRE